MAEFLLLNTLNLESVVFQFLSDFLALLQVVKSVLLLNGRVLRNLGAHHVGVVSQMLLALLLQVALSLLVCLLALDDAQEVVSLCLGLSSEGGLTLIELALTGNFELVGLALHLLLLSDLLATGLALALLECTLGS